MFDKVSKIIFIVLFLLMLTIPFATTNLHTGKISEAENRVLVSRPHFYNADGTKNRNFTKDFERWINDNIGLRSKMVIQNAKIQYYVFGVLSNNSDMCLGPKGELNYATNAIIADYQHKNLPGEDYLASVAQSFQYLKNYVESKGKQFYYFQCWDKQSIYPEYFPNTVIQYGKISKTDEYVKVINDRTDVTVISPKSELLKAKSTYRPYSKWGDATHWTQRGSYIGYLKLMHCINQNSSVKYNVLNESDYNITITDQGSTLFGGIHEVDEIENFEIKNPKAVVTNEKLTLYAEGDKRHVFYTNSSVQNNTRLLIIGDSYFRSFLVDDLAESFHEVILIWGNYLWDVRNIVDEYNADIVIVEAAEREDRTYSIITGVDLMKKQIRGKENEQPAE